MEYIITFKNTNFAIKAEQCLLEHKLRVTVLPLPPQVRAGCGICLRVRQDEITPALRTLSDRNIDEIELYSRTEENGRFAYNEIKDRSIFMEQKEHAVIKF